MLAGTYPKIIFNIFLPPKLFLIITEKTTSKETPMFKSFAKVHVWDPKKKEKYKDILHLLIKNRGMKLV